MKLYNKSIIFICCLTLPLNLWATSHEIELDIGLVADDEVTPEDSLISIQAELTSSLNAIPAADRTSGQNKLLSDFNDLNTATDPEKNSFYEALSAKKNATNSNVTRKSPATIGISGIGKRLSALRNSTRVTSFRSGSIFKNRSRSHFSLPLIFNNNEVEAGSLFDQRISGFFTGSLASSRQSETTTESGFKGTTKQLTAGADYRINNQTFGGLAIGWVNGDMDISSDGGTLSNNAATVLAYGSYNIKPNWYVDGTVSSGARYFEMNRTVAFTLNGTTTNVSAKSEPESKYIGFSLGTGYDKQWNNGHSFAALASFNYSTSTIDSFCEGACQNDPLAYSLVVGEQTIVSKMITVGGQWSQTISTNFGVLIPQFSINWITELEDKSDTINAYFTNDPDKNTMSFESGNKDLSFVSLKLAVSAVLPKGISGFIQYETQQFVDDYQQYTVSIGARKEF